MGSKLTTSKRTIFVGCLLGATIVLLVPHAVTRKCQYAFRRVFCVPLGVSRSLTLAAKPGTSPKVNHQEYLDLQRAFEKLENHAANLKDAVARQEETINRLTQLRVDPEWKKLGFVPATVFTATGNNHVVINRGTRDLVQPKRFVLAHNAIVGKVLEVDKHQATVELISGEGAFLPVHVDTPENRGLLRGQGKGLCLIQNVKYDQPVEVGQFVYANNRPELLGISVVVGQVSACTRDEEKPYFWRIEMTPAVALQKLDQVDVILPGRP